MSDMEVEEERTSTSSTTAGGTHDDEHSNQDESSDNQNESNNGDDQESVDASVEDSDDDGDSDDDEDSDEEDTDDSEEEELPPRVLPKRSTRGKRITNAHKDGDDEFWNQDFFQEDNEEDEDFEQSEVDSDVPDSDFFESEEEDDEEANDEPVRRTRRKRGAAVGKYVDPALKKKQQPKKSTVPVAASTPRGTRKSTNAKGPSTRRKSGRVATMKRTEASELKQAQTAAAAKARPKVKREKPKPLTQEERLVRAQQLEIENRHSLQMLLHIEEQKKKFTVHRTVMSGPGMMYKSTKGAPHNTLTFTRLGFQYPAELDQQPLRPMSNGTQDVDMTGAGAATASTPGPAAGGPGPSNDDPSTASSAMEVSKPRYKYFDPVSKQPYNTVEEFRTLRASAK
jgi:YL1 nuclear protein